MSGYVVDTSGDNVMELYVGDDQTRMFNCKHVHGYSRQILVCSSTSHVQKSMAGGLVY
jgi:hypothetical protein